MAKESGYKQYIGDGAYADFDGYSVVLTTENGISVQNTVVLEPEILKRFERYLVWLQKAIEKRTS